MTTYQCPVLYQVLTTYRVLTTCTWLFLFQHPEHNSRSAQTGCTQSRQFCMTDYATTTKMPPEWYFSDVRSLDQKWPRLYRPVKKYGASIPDLTTYMQSKVRF